MRIKQLLSSGKNPKWLYFIKNYCYYLIPKAPYIRRYKRLIEGLSSRSDYSYIQGRVNYYNQMSDTRLSHKLPLLREHRPQKQKVYFFDSYRYTSLFPQSYRWSFIPGDVVYVPECPSIVKSRPLNVCNINSVLMKLDKVRHFITIKDFTSWESKQDRVIFRGKVLNKEIRQLFMLKYFDHPMVDAGDVGKYARTEWRKDSKTLREHLDYKFIMALEGNDVASNLKWIMSSNSIAVMPRPTCETWFMEGTLLPNIHYIEVKSDLSDLEERLCYYIQHPDEAKKIIEAANQYVAQFLDDEREDIISYLVLDRYFSRSNQRE